MANISGDSDDNKLRGVAGEVNQIAGNDGNDIIVGRGKSDLLLGGKGDDIVKGGNGHDELFGGSGDDVVKGGNGRDTLSGDKGNDKLVGGNGNDTFVINANHVGQSHDTICDFDVDRQLRKMTFNDSVEIKNVAGQVFTFQETEDGKVELSIDGTIVATFNGSACGELKAADVLAATKFVGGSPKSVELLDANGNPMDFKISGTGNDDVIGGKPGIDNIIAGNGGDDDLNGKGKNDVLLGGAGEDDLNGANGSDTLSGGKDNDVLVGGNGADTLNGDLGSDILTGGNGGDIFEFNFKPSDLTTIGVDTVTDFEDGVDKIAIKNGDLGDLSFVNNGGDSKMFYEGELIAIFKNAASLITVSDDVILA